MSSTYSPALVGGRAGSVAKYLGHEVGIAGWVIRRPVERLTHTGAFLARVSPSISNYGA